jgi:hypothetical protein
MEAEWNSSADQFIQVFGGRLHGARGWSRIYFGFGRIEQPEGLWLSRLQLGAPIMSGRGFAKRVLHWAGFIRCSSVSGRRA